MMKKRPLTSPATTQREVTNQTHQYKITCTHCFSFFSRLTFSIFWLPDRILSESKKVFEDVVEDFHSLDNIKSHFETWRKLYFTCYRDAYIGLCLPKLFNPLIRLQLISWSPFEVQRERHSQFFGSALHRLNISVFNCQNDDICIYAGGVSQL